MRLFVTALLVLLLQGVLGGRLGAAAQAAAQAAEEQSTTDKDASPKLQSGTLADGAVQFSLPADWKSQPLRSRILESEYAVPAVEGETNNGRLTMMRSGGSVDANVTRWVGQFTQPDGKPTLDRAKISDREINGQKAKIVDIAGTYRDQVGGGPVVPGRIVEREGYRMLAAIVQTKSSGQYFFKLYGPEKTIAAAHKPFLAMVESITSK